MLLCPAAHSGQFSSRGQEPGGREFYSGSRAEECPGIVKARRHAPVPTTLHTWTNQFPISNKLGLSLS